MRGYGVEQGCAQMRGRGNLPGEPGQKIAVRFLHQRLERVQPGIVQRREMRSGKTAKDDVHFLDAAMAGPVKQLLAPRVELRRFKMLHAGCSAFVSSCGQVAVYSAPQAEGKDLAAAPPCNMAFAFRFG